MNISKLYILVCLAGLTGLSCLDPIDLDIPTGGVTDIAVDGRLVYGNPSIFEVSVSELFDFDGNPNRISIRKVELLDEAENAIEVRSQNKGVYSAEISQDDPNLTISPDKKYKIKVFLANGDLVESDYQPISRIAGKTRLKAIPFRKMTEDDDGVLRDRLALSFEAISPLPTDDETKLRWEVLRTYKFSNLAIYSPAAERNNRYCFLALPFKTDICKELEEDPKSPIAFYDCDGGGVTNAVECDRGTNPLDSLDDGQVGLERRSCYITGFEDIRNIKLFDPSLSKDNSSEFEQVLFEPTINFKFAEGFHVQLITEAISKEVFQYYAKLEEVLALTGGMFDPPAGKIKGNMVNATSPEGEVFGFFYATEHDTTNQFIDIDQVEFPDTLCLKDFKGMPPETCLDCTVWANTGDLVTIKRPSYWGKD